MSTLAVYALAIYRMGQEMQIFRRNCRITIPRPLAVEYINTVSLNSFMAPCGKMTQAPGELRMNDGCDQRHRERYPFRRLKDALSRGRTGRHDLNIVPVTK